MTTHPDQFGLLPEETQGRRITPPLQGSDA
jgi:hypothetical protein